MYCIPWGHEIKLNVQRERKSGGSYPDFETEISGDSRSTFDRGSFLGLFLRTLWLVNCARRAGTRDFVLPWPLYNWFGTIK